MAIYNGREVRIEGLLPDPGRRVRVTDVTTQETEIVDLSQLSLTDDEHKQFTEQHVEGFRKMSRDEKKDLEQTHKDKEKAANKSVSDPKEAKTK